MSLFCKTINKSHAHRTHRQRKHPRHRQTSHTNTERETAQRRLIVKVVVAEKPPSAALLFCEYMHLEFVRIHVIYRVCQAECVIQFLVDAPEEYANIYSTPRVLRLCNCVTIMATPDISHAAVNRATPDISHAAVNRATPDISHAAVNRATSDIPLATVNGAAAPAALGGRRAGA